MHARVQAPGTHLGGSLLFREVLLSTLTCLLSRSRFNVGGTRTTLAPGHREPLASPYLDQTLENSGIAADIVRTGLTRAGYRIDPKAEPWDRAMLGTALDVYNVVGLTPRVFITRGRQRGIRIGTADHAEFVRIDAQFFDRGWPDSGCSQPAWFVLRQELEADLPISSHR